ncbi:MAG: alpha/beta fold hydrolase [Xanthobacteraceae bacterium]|nr:alpha/beta fold hydrolase [Xanthobacteraceae bacterium]
MTGKTADTTSDGVVLLHGIGCTCRSMRKLERSLQQAGLATLNLSYASRKKPLEELAEDIHPAIVEFGEAIRGSLHFVGHSMGGLLARIYVANHRPSRLGRVVMLGTPNGGSEVADLLQRSRLYRSFYGPAALQLTTQQDDTLALLPPVDYAVGIVAGTRALDPIAWRFVLPRPNDGRVSVARSKLEGMADHIAIKATHTGLPRHTGAIQQTIAFLAEGRFDRTSVMPLPSRRPEYPATPANSPTAHRPH